MDLAKVLMISWWDSWKCLLNENIVISVEILFETSKNSLAFGVVIHIYSWKLYNSHEDDYAYKGFHFLFSHRSSFCLVFVRFSSLLLSIVSICFGSNNIPYFISIKLIKKYSRLWSVRITMCRARMLFDKRPRCWGIVLLILNKVLLLVQSLSMSWAGSLNP